LLIESFLEICCVVVDFVYPKLNELLLNLLENMNVVVHDDVLIEKKTEKKNWF
jgi:hypothetical protein